MNSTHDLSADINLPPARIQVVNKVYCIIELMYIPIIIGGNGLIVASVLVFQPLRTLTNCLLLSLAASDVLVSLFTIPVNAIFYIAHSSVYHQRVTCMAWFTSAILGVGSSLYNLLFIVIERFIAIHFPFFHARFKTPRNVGIALSVLWVYVFVLSFLPLMGWNQWNHQQKCTFYASLPLGYVIWAGYFSIGMCTLVSALLYVRIFLTVHRQRRRIRALSESLAREATLMAEEMRSVRLTALVFMLFVLCWTPYICVGPLMYSDLAPHIVETVKNFTLIFGYGNSMVNPIVCGVVRKQFRTAYKLLVTTPVTRWKTLRLEPDSTWDSGFQRDTCEASARPC